MSAALREIPGAARVFNRCLRSVVVAAGGSVSVHQPCAGEPVDGNLCPSRSKTRRNIFLVRGDTGALPNVVDFGLAKFLSTSREETIDTDRGQAIGTMRFMPPEQLRGHEVDPACDLWALTVMVYEMLTGTDPFAGATAAECYRAILTESFTPVSKHLPTRPDELCWGAFCDRMWFLDVTALVRDPEHRAHRARSTFLYRA